ncbi:hypothetical protein [Dehalobacter sp. TBBPA1]|uniref:hypothetical protein n=1 Tax=Dehalobacter sp. TBBPA1 TaxID=3235037 RepID=UPI0034A1B4A7
MEEYRSGCNGPDSKCGCPQGHVGSNPTFSAIEDKASSQDEAYINKKVGFERADKEKPTYGRVFPPRRESEPKASGANPTFSAIEDKASSQDEAYFNKKVKFKRGALGLSSMAWRQSKLAIK